MPAITVELVDTDPNLTAHLEKFVKARGLGPGGTPAVIHVATRAECDTIGAALAEFVATQPHLHKMLVDGPDATSEISQLHTSNDTNVLTGAVAMCSGLL